MSCSWSSYREHSSTSDLLRLECSIDCISFAILVWLLHVKKNVNKKCNWASAPPKSFSVNFLTVSAYPHIYIYITKFQTKIN